MDWNLVKLKGKVYSLVVEPTHLKNTVDGTNPAPANRKTLSLHKLKNAGEGHARPQMITAQLGIQSTFFFVIAETTSAG